LLNEKSERPCEVINAGVIGYTSLQGLRRLETDVSRWSPDVITVYFGWNDHWLARGYRDSQQRPPQAAVVSAAELLDHLRTYQLVSLAGAKLRTAQSAGAHRVELDEYADNLRQIVRAGRKLNAEVWLITAPHALDGGIPTYLTATREVDDPAGLIAMHGAYNDAVRQVAAELDAPLLDLDRELAGRPDKAALFDADHIHLSSAGKDLLAERLLQMASARGFVASPQR
jgi:lysophospholipase L1-like esterase